MSLTESPQSTSDRSKTLFTCLACHVAFPTSEGQRNHYRTDWHKYNLKRKIAELAPISAEQFAEKINATQAKGREEQERMGLIYECSVCRKSYFSENAFNNHIQSKKHRELEEQAELIDEDNEEEEEHGHSDEKRETHNKTAIENSEHECLFCPNISNDFDGNMDHMKKAHGFFLPDAEYLQNTKGLIGYLANKVNGAICLYCNGRGKEWKSLDAVRAHMVDVGHCKMAYDESEAPEELLKYYDFGDLDQDGTSPSSATVADKSSELVLNNGLRVTHRRFLKPHKNHRKEVEDVAAAAAANDDDDVSVASLPRRERRHRLAITDGKAAQQQQSTAQGIRAVSAKQHFEQQVSVKHNLNVTRRARDQVPK
ncbi:C2H2 type zinc-finger-domain-containing protein [Zychaea mexicana]|uniref:C2H2 type zinc-finger-domain-containing protein n=1 Tax=Zychaea mexicana TaxID=64656 RepID=UPI0022FDF195|nr:C2H2 type zinc-finger-domain-containing protein [Zychaea mexicana]KAI9485025.1 C2H2 type zinc-finger-domain-containing protein [Zychaea mexicana]